MPSNLLSPVPDRLAGCLPVLLTMLLLSSLTASAQPKKRNTEGANKPASQPGVYRNLLREAGYQQAAIDEKVNKAWYDIFEGPQRVYFEVGDSMAYVSDVKNHDARTEGLSYGMMIAVQLNKKDQFDRIWRWSKKYLQHQTGPREGYFAWSIDPKTLKKNSEGSASDGELYYITSLLFAANRWGNNTGIHYYNEARRILDAMWKKDGTGNIYNLINTEHKQITFVPEGNNYNWTDPSYHLPAFYEVWALYAKDGHEQFYRDCADTARVFLHRACHPVTGLNTDYAEFSGQPHPTRWMPPAFRYDSWRVPMNIAMDYTWFGKDKRWQEDYARRFQGFLRSKGMDSYEDQFNVDGSRPDFILQAGPVKKLRHSIGLVSTAATASLINKEKNSKDFVQAIWQAKLEPYEDGYFDPYYDGLLYLFSLLHLSGKYQLIKPSANLPAVAVAPSTVKEARPDQDQHGERAATNVRSAAYPQIMPGSRVAFRIKAPEAQKVQVDLGRKYEMLRDTGGYWKVTTDSISEGFHYYSLLIDGVALADPASETFYGMGRMASGIEIPFSGGDYYAVKDVPHGEIRIKRYFSTVTNSWRRFYIYTPPGYESAAQHYPVLYLLHGGGEDERGWATQGKTDLIMDNLIASKQARPMLIVMMDGNMGGGGFGEQALVNFENELKQVVVPFVESNYRAGKGAANRALAGLSMGGLQTLYAGIKNTDLFGYLGVFSSGWLPMQQAISEAQYQFIKNNKAAIEQNLQLLWIAMGGKEDIAYNNCKLMLARFDELQFKYQYSEYPGGHTWPVWRNNLYSFAPLLFK